MCEGQDAVTVKVLDLTVRAGPWGAEAELATGGGWEAYRGVLGKQSHNRGENQKQNDELKTEPVSE